jgi:glycosyltransferase involved in cell wall biosynthesis
MPRLSFIMPVKNGEPYVAQAVRSVERQPEKDWELIIVDDHSSDGTPGLLRELGREDPRIRIAENPGAGQVQAINHGYGLSSGGHLKIIDSDDLLAKDFSRNLDRVLSRGATYHDAFLFEGTSAVVDRLRVGSRFEELELPESLRRLMVSPPRWSWTFSREVGERVFPLPPDLPSPHEDVFLGLMIKKRSEVVHVPLPLYFYRQHPGQFYGGLFNFSREAVTRRAGAMLGIIKVIAASEIVEGLAGSDDLLDPSREYYGLLARRKLRWIDLLRARLPLSGKFRVAVVRKSPRLAAGLSRRRAVGKIKARSSDNGVS